MSGPRATGVLTFSLVVNDGRNASAADSISIAVQNRVPIANAGSDRIGAFGQAIEIDASGSSDPDGDTLIYTWRQISGEPTAMALLGDGRFSFPAVNTTGVRTYGLVVSDGELTSAEDIIIITVTASGTNTAPVVPPTPPRCTPPPAWRPLADIGPRDRVEGGRRDAERREFGRTGPGW